MQTHVIGTVVGRLARGELVAWDNGTVYALIGNANDPGLQDRIVQAKGNERGAKQPVGWTVPFSHALDLIDIDQVEDRSMQELLQSPSELTSYLGGVAFIRAAADMRRKEERNIPESIVPSGVLNPTIQIYSPNGNDATSKLVRSAMLMGVEPVMTSANISGKPEIVTAHDAKEFAQAANITAYVNKEDSDKASRPRGSYPVIGVESSRFVILRSGCFEPEIIKRLLRGYPIVESKNMVGSKYPENVLHMRDLEFLASEIGEFNELPKLYNAEMRAGLLAVLGWHTDSWHVRQSIEQK